MQCTSSSENYMSSLRDSPSNWNGKNDKGYVYKKTSYQYSGSGKNNNLNMNKSDDQNIDQLDALLEDLKHERQVTKERDLLSPSMSTRTMERERVDPAGTVTKTTRIIKTSNDMKGNQLFNDENFSTSDYSSYKPTSYSGLQDVQRTNKYQTRENRYDTNNTSGNLYESNSRIYENRTLENTELIPPITTTNARLENDLQNITLSDDILPVPGTKVTTTVRTYTYEIPAGITPNISNSRNQLNNTIIRNTVHQNDSSSLNQSISETLPAIPQTVVYNTTTHSTLNRNNEQPIISNQTYEIREHHETNTLRNNLMQPPHTRQETGNTKTIVNNVNTIENINSMSEHTNFPHNPIGPISGQHTPQHGSYPSGPNTHRYFYKESTNMVNTIREPGGPTELVPHEHMVPKMPLHKLPVSGYPHNGDVYSPPAVPSTSTTTYKYSSSTTNSHRGPDYGTPSPRSTLSPFPVDGVDYPVTNGSPPQKVDDLMQSFGNTNSVDRSDLRAPHRKREIETAVASPNQQNIPTINKAGKEVYYPPGHETMITKREEMSAGSAAGGRWAKGSGMYEYESGSKSKTTTKSGGAMVPVCLPLCCAMPCSIM